MELETFRLHDRLEIVYIFKSQIIYYLLFCLLCLLKYIFTKKVLFRLNCNHLRSAIPGWTASAPPGMMGGAQHLCYNKSCRWLWRTCQFETHQTICCIYQECKSLCFLSSKRCFLSVLSRTVLCDKGAAELCCLTWRHSASGLIQ